MWSDIRKRRGTLSLVEPEGDEDEDLDFFIFIFFGGHTYLPYKLTDIKLMKTNVKVYNRAALVWHYPH